jgi:hypothetical protein
MIVKCPKCQEEYDDVYRDTFCPHKTFEMHTGVVVEGKRGCAHSLTDLEAAFRPLNPALPNENCPFNQLVKAFIEDRPLSEQEAIDTAERLLHADAKP